MGATLLQPYRHAVAGFNPLTAIAWQNVYWAEDPSWTNPGNGNPVSSWRDASGNARDATETLTARPTFSSTSLAGRPALTFNGAQRLSTAAHTLPGSYSLVVIGKTDNASIAANQTFIARNNVAGMFAVENGASDRAAGIYAGSTVLSTVVNTANPRIAIGFIDTAGTTDYVWVDGVSTSAGATGNVGHASLATVIGSFGIGGSSMLTGAVAFAGIYSGDITLDAQFAAFKSWVTTTYGITIA